MINEQIRDREVRLIGPNGDQLGIMSAKEAMKYAREAELEEKCKRLAELNAELNMDKRENEIVDGAEEQSEDERDENSRTRSDRTDR